MWFHSLPWARVRAPQGGPPPKVSAGEGRRQASPAQWRLRYCCGNLSLAFPRDLEARQTDFQGRVEEQFFFLNFLNSENK